MRRIAAATLTVALSVVASAMASARSGPPSPRLTCEVTSIPARSGSVETTCRVENFAPNTVVTMLAPTITATTDASDRASATFRIPCCFEEPGDFPITATAEDGTTASTTLRVVAAKSVPGQPTLTG